MKYFIFLAFILINYSCFKKKAIKVDHNLVGNGLVTLQIRVGWLLNQMVMRITEFMKIGLTVKTLHMKDLQNIALLCLYLKRPIKF